MRTLGGVRMTGGDICESSESNCLDSDNDEYGITSVYTYPRGAGGWWV